LVTPAVECDVCGEAFFHIEPWVGYLGEIKCKECGASVHFREG
jgi:formylmethanofuran dehydrogenase subunit E